MYTDQLNASGIPSIMLCAEHLTPTAPQKYVCLDSIKWAENYNFAMSIVNYLVMYGMEHRVINGRGCSIHNYES